MKLKHTTAVLILLSIFSFAQNKESYVLIKGTTNVNTFRCTNDEFQQQISFFLENHQKNKFPETTISLTVKDFDCKNKVMSKDLKNTLNADKYPLLNITFLNLDRIAENQYRACIQVKMMNKLRKYTVDFMLDKTKLTGNKTLYFSDFDIVPPKKFGGMVAVKDALNLSFSLRVKE